MDETKDDLRQEEERSAAKTDLNADKKKKKLTKTEKWFRTMRRIYFWFLSRFAFKYKRYGERLKYNDRAYLIVGNHLYKTDVIPAAICTDRVVHFMAKSELFEKGWNKWFTKKCECIPVSRDGSDVRALMQSMKYLKAGEFVCCFPEGTRNKSDELFLPFKSGAAAIAIKTKTPVLPMVQLKNYKKRKPILYGEPFEMTQFYDKKMTPELIAEADEFLRAKLEERYHALEKIVADEAAGKKRK